jgi:hypothetical protein
MNWFEENDRAIDIALPVVAVECEATPPISGYLDAYEEAVLKFIDIGLSTHGIARAMNATESLIEDVITNLEGKQYVEKEKGRPWRLTEYGQRYLKGEEDTERSSNCSQYGFMFINAIKKEVLPFFHTGDINQISLFRGKQIPYKLTVNGDEKNTFKDVKIKKSRLREAYKKYYKNKDVKQDFDDGEITYQEALDSIEEIDDIFIDIDSLDDLGSFDEAECEDDKTLDDLSEKPNSQLTSNMYIRALEKSQKKIYLRMRIIIDPSVPGGYRVESPFRMAGIDNGYFLRQVQWLVAAGNTKINGEDLSSYLEHEIRKISPSYHNRDKDFDVFVLEKMPLLKSQRNKHGNIYEDMARIYSLIQNQQSLLEKENIVSNISRSVLECLFNEFFRTTNEKKRKDISKRAQCDLEKADKKIYIQRICKKTKLDPDKISWSFRFMSNAIGRLGTTKGNSTIEKFINILVINYYLGTPETDKLLNNKNIQDLYTLADDLNQIRRKVSHDTDDRFEPRDYEFFMSKVFKLINWLLEVYREE